MVQEIVQTCSADAGRGLVRRVQSLPPSRRREEWTQQLQHSYAQRATYSVAKIRRDAQFSARAKLFGNLIKNLERGARAHIATGKTNDQQLRGLYGTAIYFSTEACKAL